MFATSTGLKIEPAAPVPFAAKTFSWLATQRGGGFGWVVVVVVDDALVVDVVGASVVKVDVGAAVVEGGTEAWEHPAATTANPRIMPNRPAAADLERRMSLLAWKLPRGARCPGGPSDVTATLKYDGERYPTRVNCPEQL